MTYEPVIGLEVHARIRSQSKLFCRCSNDTFAAAPNTHICPICSGFPGMLPLPNREAIRLGAKAALALGCAVAGFSKFDRKSYFYPDLPKGYQISQYDEPVSKKGSVSIVLPDGRKKAVGVNRLHLEDDAGKLTHAGDLTLIDFNRSGSPLMEIVSEPELFSVAEASAYARQVQKILRYVEASDADMEKGQMRFDINVSLRPAGEKKFGVKVEVKNLNSFRSLEKALEYEIKRQTELLLAGKTVAQETRGWDDEKEVTVSQRSKEEAAEYRYFPEPDLPPLTFTAGEIAALKKEIPELPDAKAERYMKDLGLNERDAEQIAGDIKLANYFEAALNSLSIGKGGDGGSIFIRARKMDFSGKILAEGGHGLTGGKGGQIDIQSDEIKNTGLISASGGNSYAKKVANWLLSELIGLLNKESQSISSSNLSPAHLAKLVKLIEDGTITGKIAKDIFPEVYAGNLDPEATVEKKGLKVVTDTGALEKIVKEVIAENEKAAADYRGGKKNALGSLVGQVMAKTRGAANPQAVNQLLNKLLA